MKAIVQSCDRYHSFTENMLTQYEKLWPSNPFMFRIPWNTKYPETIDSKFQGKIDLIKTGIPFKETFHELTKDLDGEEWVYWCIDDKYPIHLQEDEANKVLDFVRSVEDPRIISVGFHPVRNIKESSDSIQKMGFGIQMFFSGLKFIEHKSFSNNWLHQFFRVKALREFWSYIKEPKPYQAKSMDNYVRPLRGTSLVLDHSICTYGESTYKGFITQNCQSCFIENNISVPDYFLSQDPQYIII